MNDMQKYTDCCSNSQFYVSLAPKVAVLGPMLMNQLAQLLSLISTLHEQSNIKRNQ